MSDDEEKKDPNTFVAPLIGRSWDGRTIIAIHDAKIAMPKLMTWNLLYLLAQAEGWTITVNTHDTPRVMYPEDIGL